jgi:hypothetical protein
LAKGCWTTISAAALVANALIWPAGPAAAAPITWSTPTAITSADQALTQSGTVDYAVAWGTGTTTVTLTNGHSVTFQAGTIDGNGLVEITGADGIAPANTSQYSGTSNGAFNSVMGGFVYDGTETTTLTGLTVGNSYQVELFSVDDRGPFGARDQTFTDQNGDTSTAFLHNANDFVIGSFVADATTETFTNYGTGGCPGSCSVLNATVVYSEGSGASVPEPATLILMGTGLGVLGWAKQRRGRL